LTLKKGGVIPKDILHRKNLVLGGGLHIREERAPLRGNSLKKKKSHFLGICRKEGGRHR